MSSSQAGDTLPKLIRKVLAAPGDGADKATVREAQRFFSSIVRLDYRKSLTKQLDQYQLREILRELRRWLPELNRRVFSEVRINQLARRAADLGAVLQATPYDGERGRALRGYYLSADHVSRHPTLYVNTAVHPVLIAATFWHEVGHHLTHEILGAAQGAAFLTFTTDYAAHLTSLDELLADIVMTLGCYPKQVALRLFGAQDGRDAKPEAMIMSAQRYVAATTGLDFNSSAPAQDAVYQLAGMIHLAKLRAVLLNEYGI